MKKKYIDLSKYGKNQKLRKKYFESTSIRHPAKMDLPLCRWIIDKFCLKDKPEIILDPMAGIGSTLIMGILMCPNSLFLGIELEEKFVKWCNASIKKTEKIVEEDWFMKIGKAICIKGDARELEKVLKEKVNKIISSPPYGGQVQHKTNYLGKQKRESGFEYSDNPENIGNKPHGNVDKIISSPPYSEIRMDGGGKDRAGMRPYTDESSDTWRTQRDQRNIGNLKHGRIDKIITSPPFGQAQSGGGIAKKGYTGPKYTPHDVGSRSYMPENTGENKNNISNLPYVDKVISSPPYGGAPMPEDKGPHIGCRNIRTGYTKDKENIGNLKQQTYLQAMFMVYWECYKVLKSQGLMILITKDFIRNKKRVRLGEDTIKLCRMAGFKYIKTYHRKIENPSFWRILYTQKYPEVEQIDCEDILCFRKENEN